MGLRYALDLSLGYYLCFFVFVCVYDISLFIIKDMRKFSIKWYVLSLYTNLIEVRPFHCQGSGKPRIFINIYANATFIYDYATRLCGIITSLNGKQAENPQNQPITFTSKSLIRTEK